MAPPTRTVTEATKDLTAKLGGSAANWQYDGKTYGVPFSLGVVGFCLRVLMLLRERCQQTDLQENEKTEKSSRQQGS